MEKHPYDQLIETVADKMKQHEDDNLGLESLRKWTKIWDCHEEPLGTPQVGKTTAILDLVMRRVNQFSRTPDADCDLDLCL